MDQRLTVFLTVVEKKNFTRAAETLHMSQPAISQYVKSLEESLGTPLLDRNSKTVEPNKAGEIVYHYAKEIMGLHVQMQTLVDDLLNKVAGKISIGASYTFGEYVMPHVVAYLKKNYPLIKPKITIANTRRISEWVASRQLDIGIIDGNSNHPQLVSEPFASDNMFVVVPKNHPLLSKIEVTPSDLRSETWIVREETSGTRQAVEQMFSRYDFRPENLMEFGSTQVIKNSVEAGLGITMLSHCTLQKEIAFGSLQLLPLSGFPFQRQFSFVTQSTPFKTKAVRVFIDILRKNETFPEFFTRPTV